VMAEALAAGNNPYELQVPEMTTTVGVDYRTRMFGWAQKNSPYLFEAEAGARVAVLYSSPSRDYVDKFQGLGMFVTWDSNDSLWWAGDPIDSAYERQYLAEYRGMVKLLVHEHIPFDSVVRPDLAELSSYETVILPDIEAISDAEADILRQYVQNGGHLVVTGPNPTGLDEYGTARSEYALANVLGFGKSDPLPAETQNSYGGGTVLFFSTLLGKTYFVNSDASAHQNVVDAIQATSTIPLTTNADRRVHFELSQLGEETILQFVNFIGVNGSFSVVPTTFSVSLDIPAGKQVTGVALTSPDSPNTPALDPIPYTASNQQVSFDVALDQYALVVVSLDGAQTPQNNNKPVAGKDDFNTDVDTPLDFTDAMLLANDGDLDGDALVVTAVDAANASGLLTDHAGGSYTYTPPPGFTGSDSLTYTISDSKGGEDSGRIDILVAPPTTLYYPEAVTVTTGAYDWGTMASFMDVDNDTYDINSAAVSGGRAADWYAETTVSESPGNIAQIKVTHIGQYNQAGVSQDFYVYNFQDAVWELVDTTTVGNEDDVPVSWVTNSEIAKYVSAQGKLWTRVRGFKSASSLWSWSNAMYWEISQAFGGTATNTPPVAAFNSTCTELDCTFTDQSSDPDGTISGWGWTFGDGGSSSDQSPTHNYAAAGTYTVTLTVTDDGGATSIVAQNVSVSAANQTPNAAFTFACTNLDCTFTDQSSDPDGTISGWGWTFDDGGSSSDQSPTHNYAAAGTYTVTLTVTDDGGATNTVSHGVTVITGTNLPVEATFISIPAEDGWVLESGENTDTGGRLNTGGSGSKAIRMGDNKADRQYKSILSFDTSSIPDGATIVSATLQLTRGGNKGENPFNTHGTCYVDVSHGSFGDNPALQNSDFQAPADGYQVAIVTNQGGSGTLYVVNMEGALDRVNKAGRTQLRLYFSNDDNDDRGDDFAGFYSANNSNVTHHPRLIVTYQE
jgi:PKD repeat protein